MKYTVALPLSSVKTGIEPRSFCEVAEGLLKNSMRNSLFFVLFSVPAMVVWSCPHRLCSGSGSFASCSDRCRHHPCHWLSRPAAPDLSRGLCWRRWSCLG